MTKRKAPEDKLPVGRPSLFKPEYAAQAKKLCELGATDADLAEAFQVNTTTIWRWQSEYPEFCKSLKAGKAEADDIVERSLFQRARGYTFDAVKIFMPKDATAPVYAPYREHAPPDTTACIFWLKNRRPDLWRDRHEVTGKNGAPIEVRDAATGADLSEHEVRILRQILQARDSEPEAGAEGTGQAGLPGTTDRLH